MYRLTYALNRDDIYTLMIEADTLYEGVQRARTIIDGEYGPGAFDRMEAFSLIRLEASELN